MNNKCDSLARIVITGVVQGVGFRPFIYKLAHTNGLQGWVRNTSGSVEIEIEGPKSNIEAFLVDLKKNSPPAARIKNITVPTCSGFGRAGHEG